jgi:hypothetical protein
MLCCARSKRRARRDVLVFGDISVIMKLRPLRCSYRSMKLLEPNTLSWGAESLMLLCMSALQRKA